MNLKKFIILGCISVVVTILAVVSDISFVNMLIANEHATSGLWTLEMLLSGIVISAVIIGMELMTIVYSIVNIVKASRRK